KNIFYFYCKNMLATTAPNSLVMNPTSMLVEMKNFIP
ncbi:organellar and viral DNA polymerase type B, partial [Trichomonas vaginalis G3]